MSSNLDNVKKNLSIAYSFVSSKNKIAVSCQAKTKRKEHKLKKRRKRLQIIKDESHKDSYYTSFSTQMCFFYWLTSLVKYRIRHATIVLNEIHLQNLMFFHVLFSSVGRNKSGLFLISSVALYYQHDQIRMDCEGVVVYWKVMEQLGITYYLHLFDHIAAEGQVFTSANAFSESLKEKDIIRRVQ